MILFINGPFGVGKSTTASEIVRMLPNAMLMDPEEIGSFLRQLLGSHGAAEDYQDLRLWRTLTIEMAGHLRREFGRDLVMPMCVYRREYFNEIIGGLSVLDDVASFQLVAERETLERRIIDSAEARSWRLKHLRALPPDFPDPSFGTPVATDTKTPAEVAHFIISRLSSDTVQNA